MTALLKCEQVQVAFDIACGYAAPHVSTPQKALPPPPTAEVEVECDTSLNARMKAAAMTPLSQLLSGNPSLPKGEVLAGVRDIVGFGAWLTTKHREFMRLRMAYALGDRDKADALYEWVLAHSTVYGEVAATFRAALCKKGTTTTFGAKG